MLPWEPWQLFAWHSFFFFKSAADMARTYFSKTNYYNLWNNLFLTPERVSRNYFTWHVAARQALRVFTHLSSPTWIFLAFISKNPCTIVAHWTTIAARRKLNPILLNPYFLRNVIRRPNPTNSMKCRPWNTATKDTYVKANSSVEKKSPSFSCRVYPDIWNQAWRLPRLLGGRLHRNLRRLGIG